VALASCAGIENSFLELLDLSFEPRFAWIFCSCPSVPPPLFFFPLVSKEKAADVSLLHDDPSSLFLLGSGGLWPFVRTVILVEEDLMVFFQASSPPFRDDILLSLFFFSHTATAPLAVLVATFFFLFLFGARMKPNSFRNLPAPPALTAPFFLKTLSFFWTFAASFKLPNVIVERDLPIFLYSLGKARCVGLWDLLARLSSICLFWPPAFPSSFSRLTPFFHISRLNFHFSHELCGTSFFSTFLFRVSIHLPPSSTFSQAVMSPSGEQVGDAYFGVNLLLHDPVTPFPCST